MCSAKRNKDRPEPIKNIVDGVLKDWGGNRLVQEEAIRKAWQKAVGRKGVPHTRIRSYRTGRLVIEVDSSGWLYQLSMQKQDLTAKLNRQLKTTVVQQLQFRIGDFR